MHTNFLNGAAAAAATEPQQEPQRGWFGGIRDMANLGKHLEAALIHLGRSGSAGSALTAAVETAPEELTVTLTLVENLHRALHGKSRSKLIIAVTETRNVLQRATDTTAVAESLSTYLNYLNGGHSCTKVALEGYRKAIIASLDDLILRLQTLRTQNRGAFDPALEKAAHTFAQHVRLAVGEQVIRPIFGRNPLVDTSVGDNDDIDLPPLEEVAEPTPLVVVHYKEEGLTFMKWIEAISTLLSEGKTDGVSVCACTIALKILKQMHATLNEKRDVASPNVLADLRQCIALLESAPTAESAPAAFQEVRRIMSSHPIWFGSLGDFGIPLEWSASGLESEEIILSKIQELRNEDTIPPSTAPPYESQVSELVEELAVLGSRQMVHQTLLWYFGETPSYIRISPFSEIMERVHKAPPAEQNALFIKECRALLDKASHRFFVTRWLLKRFTPMLVWVCEVSAQHFAKGVFAHMREFIVTAKSPRGKKISTAPIDRFRETMDSLYEAHKHSQTTHTGKPKNRTPETLEAHSTTTQEYGTAEQLFRTVSDHLVNRYMLKFTPTAKLYKLSDTLSERMRHAPIVFKAPLFLIKIALWLINTLVVFPFEWTVNTVTHTVTRTLLRRTNALHQAYTLTGDALFTDAPGSPTSRVVNTLVKNVLEELSHRMDMPSDGLSATPPISDDVSAKLEEGLLSLLNMVAIASHSSTPQMMSDFLARRDEGALHKIMRELFNKDLDREAAGTAKILLAQCYHLIMDKDVLYQQLFLTLTSVKSGMLGPQSTLTAEELVQAQHEETRTRQLAQYYRRIVVQKAARMAHAAVATGGDPDRPLRDHIRRLQTDLEASLATWQVATREAPTLSELRAVHATLLTQWDQLYDSLFTLKSDVGAASFTIHKKNLKPLITALEAFQNSFLTLYTAKLREALRDQPALGAALLKGCIDLQAFFRATATPLILIEAPADCPGTLRSLIERHNAFVAHEAPRLRKDQTTQEVFEHFHTHLEWAIQAGIETHLKDPKSPPKTLHSLPYPDVHPYQETVKAHEAKIIERLVSVKDPVTAREQAMLLLTQLLADTRREYALFSSSHTTDLTAARSRILDSPSSLCNLLQEEAESFTPTAAAAASRAAPRRATPAPHPIEEALAGIKQAVATLRHSSSIIIPLDLRRIPFFTTTEGYVIAYVDTVLGRIQRELIQRHVLMSLVVRGVVIPICESTR